MSTQYKSSRDVPTEVLAARLNELADVVAQKRGRIDAEFTMRIPAECDRDADLVMSEAARRLSAAPAVQGEPVAWLEGEPSMRGTAPTSLTALTRSTRLHMTKPSTSNPVWPLYTAPQSAAKQPDVTQLGGLLAWLDAFVAVSAQAGIDDHEEAWTWPSPPTDPGFFDSYPQLTAGDLRAVHDALSPYRKGGSTDGE